MFAFVSFKSIHKLFFNSHDRAYFAGTMLPCAGYSEIQNYSKMEVEVASSGSGLRAVLQPTTKTTGHGSRA
jgi:hypothetical protein